MRRCGKQAGVGYTITPRHAAPRIAAYGFLMAQRLKAGNSASRKKNFAQRHVPGLPKDYIPRGSPARTASWSGLRHVRGDWAWAWAWHWQEISNTALIAMGQAQFNGMPP